MIGWELPPNHSGGLGVACLQLCQELSDQGVDIEFMLPYKYTEEVLGFMKVHAALDITAEQLPSDKSVYSSSAFYDASNRSSAIPSSVSELEAAYVANISSAVETIDFDIIHAHDWLTLRAAIEVRKASNRPLVVHVHATEYDRAGGEYGNPTVHKIEREGFAIADKVIAVSERIKQTLTHDYNIDSDKIEVMRNGIEPKSIPSNTLAAQDEYSYVKYMKSNGYQVIGSLGRLSLQKNIHALIRAAAVVMSQRPKTLLLIVGGGEQREELIEYACELGVSRNVLFVDFQTKESILSGAFGVMDVFVMPSISEPFGLTPLEAALSGCPVIISRQSGVAEVFNNCLKVDFWDFDFLVTAIYEVLISPPLSQELAQNGRAEAKKLNWRQPVKSLISTYNIALTSPEVSA